MRSHMKLPAQRIKGDQLFLGAAAFNTFPDGAEVPTARRLAEELG